MKDAGFKQDALYLIRPNGHVALVKKDKQWLRVLNMYLWAFGIVAFEIVAFGIVAFGAE